MFLFILESIGTSELILIGIIALIFLGPRKLPQIARTIGKTMADFRKTTDEFKATWEREVNFDEEAQAIRSGELSPPEPLPIPRSNAISDGETNTIAAPTITPARADSFSKPDTNSETTEAVNDRSDEMSDKKNWL